MKELRLAPYPTVARLYLTNNIEQLITNLNRRNKGLDIDYTDWIAGKCVEAFLEGGYHYMFVIVNPEYFDFPRTAAHEAAHATNFTLNRLGIKFDVNNDEPYTYLIGEITQELHNLLEKYNKTNKAKCSRT